MSATLITGPLSISVKYCEMITAQHAAQLAQLAQQGVSMSRFPRPQANLEAPMLSVASLKNGNADVLPHWLSTDVVCPILPQGHGTFRFSITVPSQEFAVQIGVKGINVKTSLLMSETEFVLNDKPRQDYFVGSVDLGGMVDKKSERVRQFAVLSQRQARADIAAYRQRPATHPYGDAITAGIFFPALMEKVLSVNSSAVQPYQYESYRSAPAMSMSLGLETAAKGVNIGAGGYMDEKHPDDPSVTAASFQPNATFVFCVRLVPVAYWNDLAKAIEIDPFSFEQMQSLVKAQAAFERRMGMELQVGHDTGTTVDELPEIPYEDEVLEVMRPKGLGLE